MLDLHDVSPAPGLHEPGQVPPTVTREQLAALRRIVQTTREGCELALRSPPASAVLARQLEVARRQLVDDCALVEELERKLMYELGRQG